MQLLRDVRSALQGMPRAARLGQVAAYSLVAALVLTGPAAAVPPSKPAKQTEEPAAAAPAASTPAVTAPAAPAGAGAVDTAKSAPAAEATAPPTRASDEVRPTPASLTASTPAGTPKVEGTVVEPPKAQAAEGAGQSTAKKKAAGKAKKDQQEAASKKVVRKRIVKANTGRRDSLAGIEYEVVEVVEGEAGVEETSQSSATQTAAFVDPAKVKAGKAKAAEVGAGSLGSGFDLFGGDEPVGDLSLGTPTLSQKNVAPLKAAIERYGKIVEAGGWPAVPPLQMEAGSSGPAVLLLRRRLEAEGDLQAGGFSFGGESYFDSGIAQALQRFQKRNGLRPTGDLLDKDRTRNGTRTLTALNVPASARLAQLKANLTRLQGFAGLAGKRYVVVNIPAQQIEAVDADQVQLRLGAVVGKPDRPSPTLSSRIHELNFNPTWTVPPTVLREDLVPKGRELQRKQQNVLLKYGIDAYDGSGRKVDPTRIDWNSAAAMSYRYTQQPSKDNPMGFVKINFNSPSSVYMHDTPSKKLFDREYRAASSGCVRVEDAARLVTWLLKGTEGWSAARVAEMKESGERLDVRLKNGVPLYWVYLTAWAGEDGTVQFRRDIYGKDQAFGVDKMASAY